MSKEAAYGDADRAVTYSRFEIYSTRRGWLERSSRSATTRGQTNLEPTRSTSGLARNNHVPVRLWGAEIVSRTRARYDNLLFIRSTTRRSLARLIDTGPAYFAGRRG